MGSSRRVCARRVPTAAVVVLVAVSLAGCSALGSVLGRATAPVGARPGIDVPSDAPSDAGASPLARPALAPLGAAGFAFLASRPDGSPVRFDPCRPLHLVVRPDGEPPGGRALLLAVLGELSAATGLQLIVDGETDEGPDEARVPYQPERYGDRWAPVLVTWSSPDETTMLTDQVLGRAGPDGWGTGADQRFVSGIAVFNAPAIGQQLVTGEDDRARAVLLHELGHLVGLGHVTDPFQVMYDTNS